MSNIVPSLTLVEPGVGPGQDYWPTVPGPGGGGGLSAFAGGVIWRPGGATQDNVLATWSEIQAAIAATHGALIVFVDDSLASATVPSGTTDCQGRVVFTSAFQHELPSTVKLILPDGSILKDVKEIYGFLTVETHGVTTPNLVFTPDRALTLHDGGVLSNVGTEPVIRLAAGAFFVIIFAEDSAFSNVTPGSGPLIDLSGAGAQAVLFSVTGGGYTGNNVVTGVAGSSAIFQFDASLGGFPTNPGFAGATSNFFLDDALFISYTPAVLANWSGVAPTSIANALDRIAAKIGPIP